MVESSRNGTVSVKTRKGLAHHLEGWQPGLFAVFIAFVSAMLAVPRAVAPSEIPEPFIAPRDLEPVARQDQALADAAEREPLDTDVRALGSAMRAYNLVDATNDVEAVGRERRAVAEAARLASARGEATVARLRAYQLRSFLRELRRWEATGVESTELRELGGPFVSRAEKNGWVEGRKIIADDTVRAVLFKKRWSDLALARSSLLDITNAETRAFLRFVILHPPRDPSSNTADPRDKVSARRIAEQGEQYRLKKIEELRALDPAYPADLAQGVVLYRLHRLPRAVEAFRRFLDAHPDGPNVVRAQNYLRAAIEASNDLL